MNIKFYHILYLLLTLIIICFSFIFKQNFYSFKEGNESTLVECENSPEDMCCDDKQTRPLSETDHSNCPYNYDKKVKTPKKLNVTDEGEFSAIEDNINALTKYGDSLGKKNDSVGNLNGPAFFLNTDKDCLNKDDAMNQIYGDDDNINRETLGKQHVFLNFSSPLKNEKGLLNSISYQLSNIQLGDQFKKITNPEEETCVEVILNTRTHNNNWEDKPEISWISSKDAAKLHPCLFADGTNELYYLKDQEGVICNN